MKTISVLGATGSIGDSTLDVVARHPDRYRVHALSVNCLAVLLGRDRHDLPEITGILRRAIRSHDPNTIDRAILVWLAPPRTRGERLAGLLKLDPSFATLGHV